MTGLDKLPEEVIASLKGLSADDLRRLADDIYIDKRVEYYESLTSDAEEAIEAIRARCAERVTDEIDCAYTELVDLLSVLRLVLSSNEREGLDAADMVPIWRLAERAHDMALHVKGTDRLISDHIRAVTHPRKK